MSFDAQQIRRRRRSGSLLAVALAGSETDILAVDFTDLSLVIRDTTTPANNYVSTIGSKFTYSSPSTKWILNKSGVYESGTTIRTEYNASGVALGVRIEEARTNLFLNSRSPVTQNITTSATTYTLSALGTGTIALSGSATGTLFCTGALDRDSLTFVASAGTLTVTCSGTLDFVQVEAGAFKTSPIVTAGSTVTRVVDNIYIPTSAFPYSTTQHTMVAEMDSFVTTFGTHRALALNLNGAYGTGNGSSVYLSGATASGMGGNATAITKAISPTLTSNSMIKIAGGMITTGTIQTATNRGQVVASNATSDWTGTSNRLQFGMLQATGAQIINGHLKTAVYIPRYDTAVMVTRTT